MFSYYLRLERVSERESSEWIIVTARATKITREAINMVVATVLHRIMVRTFIYGYIEKR